MRGHADCRRVLPGTQRKRCIGVVDHPRVARVPVPERLSQDAFNRLREELSLSITRDDDGDCGIPLMSVRRRCSGCWLRQTIMLGH